MDADAESGGPPSGFGARRGRRLTRWFHEQALPIWWERARISPAAGSSTV